MEFNNSRGDYHTRDWSKPLEIVPPGASKDWPNYRCRNGCGYTTTPESDVYRCPKCQAPLNRWIRYEEKRRIPSDAL